MEAFYFSLIIVKLHASLFINNQSMLTYHKSGTYFIINDIQRTRFHNNFVAMVICYSEDTIFNFQPVEIHNSHKKELES